MDYSSLEDRDLDLEVAKKVLGWTQCVPTGVDYHGVKYPDVYGPNPSIADGHVYPPSGEIHSAYFAPNWSSKLNEALSLCRMVKLETPACELPASSREIVILCLKWFEQAQ